MIGTAMALLILGPGSIGQPIAGAEPDTTCIVMDWPVTERVSPIDSLTFELSGHTVKICYGRPSARGRTMLGGRDVPYGRLWRTGADEPTMIHTTVAISVAGMEIDPGTYSMYTVPGENEWLIILNRSVTQWGHIARYTYKVRRQEVGRVEVRRERLNYHVETLTFRAEPKNGEVTIVLEWEYTRIPIPIKILDRNQRTGGS